MDNLTEELIYILEGEVALCEASLDLASLEKCALEKYLLCPLP